MILDQLLPRRTNAFLNSFTTVLLHLLENTFDRKHISVNPNSKAVFTLNGFGDQERNLTFVKTDFQVLKFKFHACNFKQAFYSLYT